ncbi:MAG: polymer-forming cytoskeletal protein [Paracoccaceae bacterium]|nr:polymer-forming cytoskeletal protein [Paracoccaceae bacterium]
MFSKPKIGDAAPEGDASKTPAPATATPEPAKKSDAPSGSFQAKPKASPSLLSSDLTIKGNVITSGDIQIEGTIEGDVRAHLLTVGEAAKIKGEISADDVVVNGHVVGRLRGLKVRLASTAKVEGDIVHKNIAIESGAHFEGTVQRQEDPLGDSGSSQNSSRGRSGSSTSTSTSTSSAPAASEAANS